MLSKKVNVQFIFLAIFFAVALDSPLFSQGANDSVSAKVTTPHSVMAGEKLSVHVELNSLQMFLAGTLVLISQTPSILEASEIA